MLKHKKVIMCCVAVLVATLGIVFCANFIDSKKETQYLSASWNYNYRDIEEISQSSDLIALVSVQNVENTEIQQSIPYTTYSVKVETPVYNSEENQEFSIYMTGGETEDKIIEIADDPLLQAGDEILVFCKENPDGTYQIISGPQGRLIYDNGKLNSLNVVNTRVREANSFSNIVVQNVDADALIAEIKSYVGVE